MEKYRVETFSDGVFAIAMTLLVLDLKVPLDANGHLTSALLHEWPAYAGYLVSFTLIGIIWVNHHALFRDLASVDRPLLFLNLLLLLFVVLIPFPTSLAATYIRSETDSHIAAAVYSAVMLGMAVSFTAIWVWAVRNNLIRWQVSRAYFRRTLGRCLVGVVFYSFAIGLSFLYARLTLGLHVVVALFYVLDQCIVQDVDPVADAKLAETEAAEA